MKTKFLKVAFCALLVCVVAIIFSAPTYAFDLNYSGGSVSNNTGATDTTSVLSW